MLPQRARRTAASGAEWGPNVVHSEDAVVAK
jgi:hypothetical protein